MFLIIRPGISFECESERSVNEIVGFLAMRLMAVRIMYS